MTAPHIERVGPPRGWEQLSIDGRTATVPGEVIVTDLGVRWVSYIRRARWDDDGSELSPDLLEQIRNHLDSPHTWFE